MKSVLFTFKKSKNHKRRKRQGVRLQIPDIRAFLRRYGVQVFFVFLLLSGLVAGALCARNADLQLLSSLDFLFTTNLDARLSQSVIGTFCACFASDFVFLLTLFLLGLAPWGILAMPFVVLFKGFGTGLTAGYLIAEYSLKGAGFYLLVLLPGTFLFCIALVMLSANAFGFSKRVFQLLTSRNVPAHPVRGGVISYCSRSMSALIMTFCSALLDTALWTLFSGAFNF
jgi:stage II sporulation protein M